jgi:hypothetical protein
MLNDQNDRPVCQRCQHENELGAIQCAWCGAPLTSDTTTVQIPDLPSQPSFSYPAKGLGPLGEGVSFYIAGEVRPLIIRGRNKIILGRHAGEEQSPAVVDLTPYNGGLLGVSRRHALIAATEEGYTVEDLGSTNGTWLNERQLPVHMPFMLRTGDQVRLGQLILFIYFAGESSKQTIYLREATPPSPESPQFSAYYLGQSVTPYLNAVVGIQQVLDGLTERTPGEAAIEAISINAREARISVSLDGAREAVRLVQDIVEPWKRHHADLLNQVRALPGTAPDQVYAGEPDTEQARLLRSLNQAQTELAKSLLDEVSPATAADIDNSYVEHLLPHLHVLALSTLVIENDRAEET